MSVNAVVVLFFLVTFPFGPALQNLGMVLALIFMVSYRVKHPPNPRLALRGPMLWAALSMALFLIGNVLSSALNPDNHSAEKLAYFLGYSPLVILPWLAAALPPLSDKDLRQLESTAAIIALIWGLVAVSQVIWMWKWVGLMPAFSGVPRAQGFYSHPLTLAYAALLVWPFCVIRLFQKPRAWQSWFFALGILLTLIYSMSRTAQALAAACVLLNVFQRFSGRRRWQILGMVGLLGLGLALSKNPVSTRFRHLIEGSEANYHFSEYPDDRLAFWHAHLLMIKDRPILGHGVHLDLEFRHPYYVRIGLGDFKKQYPAHNQYLQIMTEGGVIALALFAAWMFFGLRALRDSQLPAFLRAVGMQTLWIFALGGLTQNAFYDVDVRMALVGLWVVVALYTPNRRTQNYGSAV